MKKYLVKGALALFGGAFLFSCADKETDYVPIVEQKVKAYEDVFKEVFGDIDPYQNWGFSNDLTLADESTSEVVYVDSVVPTPNRSRTRAGGVDKANTNANMWGRTYSNVPETLTVAQKKRAQLFFQYNNDPQDEPVHLTTFFVQDVYKGGTSPLNDGTSEKAQYSTEKYSLNGNMEKGSDHMDYLTSGPDNDHINNYNNAKCSTNNNVWDGRTYQPGYPLTAETAAAAGIGDWEAENFNHVVYHSDEIMLMEGSSTDCFGWHETVGDIFHNDYYRIISGATIDAWATEFAKDHPGLDLGASVTGRNFVGFDYERVIDISSLYERSWPNNEIVYHSSGKPYLTNAMHTYGYVVVQPDASGNYPEGSYPVYQRYVEGSNNTINIWVKPTGCADGYFSDWIVCIVGAQGKTITSREKIEKVGEEKKVPVDPQCGRIFCEDLGVSSREDLDFNDVVFDVDIYQHYEAGTKYYYTIYSDGRKVLDKQEPYSTLEQATYTAEITLQAAGGTIPLTVAGQEVHGKFGVGITTMVNTRDENSTAFGSYVTGVAPVFLGEFTPSQLFPATENDPGKSDTDPIYAYDIPIVVQYATNGVNVLGSTLGGAPAKIFVPNHSTKWSVERKQMTLAYPKFADYVGNKSIQWWNDPELTQDEVNRASYYRFNDVKYTGAARPPIVITRITYPSTSLDNLFLGSMSYTTWKVENIGLEYDTFYPGDYLIFYFDGLTDDSHITVVFADNSKPYFIDTQIPNYDLDAQGKKINEKKTSGVIEVKLDEDNARKLNASKVDGKVTLQVQGRNFTLTAIKRGLFE